MDLPSESPLHPKTAYELERDKNITEMNKVLELVMHLVNVL